MTLPAPAPGGTRPQTRYSYTLTSGIYLQAGVSTCQTGAAPACAGSADEVKTTIAYDANGNAISVSKGAGDGSLTATTTATYTSLGDVLTVDGPLVGTADTTTYRYDAARRQVGVIDPDPDGAGALKQRAVKTTYDTAGRAIQVELGTVTGTSDPNWAAFVSAQQETVSYVSGRPATDVVTAGGTTYAVTQYSYDADGRIDCTATRMNSAAWGSLPSSACTLQTAGSAGPDRIARTGYDAVGRVNKTTSAYGTTDAADDATATFSDNGRIATLIDANGNKTTYEYDGVDQLLKTRYPVATAGSGTSSTTDYEQLGYDANGNVTSRRLRDAQTLYYSYDALNRRTYDDNPGTNVAEVDVAYSYDNLGRLTRAQDGNGWFSAYAYNALGQLIHEDSNLANNAFAYDLAGRLVAQGWNDGFYVNYDRLVTGEVSAIRENNATSGVGVLATYGYDDLGRRTSLVRGNGTTTSYGYDAASRLTSLSHDVAGTSYDIAYGYGYNPAGQITSRTASNDGYAWGGSANRNYASGVNGLNQVTSVGAGSLSYDARGNLTGNGGATTFVYNTRNQLFSDNHGDLLYRGPNGLLGQTAFGGVYTNIDNARGSLSTEFDGSTGAVLRRYVFGPGDDEPLVWYEGSGTSDRRWLHADERGDVVAVSVASGNVTAINSYDEYGVPGPGNVGRFQYTGQKYIPELGLYDYKARMYSSRLGRFLQTDPIGYADGLNWYNYAGGDPVNASDPSGLDANDIIVTGTRPTNSFVIPVFNDFNYGTIDLLGRLDGGVPAIIVNGTRPKKSAPVAQTPQSANATIPDPPSGLPGGPYTPKPATPGNRPGSFLGPKQPKGPRTQAQWVPPEAEGGPPGSKGYWKTQFPGEDWQRYGPNNNPMTPDEAHPNPLEGRSYFFLGPVGAFLCLLFCSSPAR